LDVELEDFLLVLGLVDLLGKEDAVAGSSQGRGQVTVEGLVGRGEKGFSRISQREQIFAFLWSFNFFRMWV
jgi:hypothetical protein